VVRFTVERVSMSRNKIGMTANSEGKKGEALPGLPPRWGATVQ
jgi:hypothetical protein